MHSCNLDNVRHSISIDRMQRYISKCNGSEDNALTLYGFNMKLCEAFYTPLHCAEVTLRNHLHNVMAEKYASGWMTNGGPVLDTSEQDKINEAIRERERHSKASDPPGLVSEIKFSFWVGLLGPGYDNTLWRSALHKAFKAQSPSLKRKTVHGRFNMIRRFRNRVAHHEPIWSKDLKRTNAEIVDAISWMCPDKASWTASHSRVDEVYDEYQNFLKSLTRL